MWILFRYEHFSRQNQWPTINCSRRQLCPPKALGFSILNVDYAPEILLESEHKGTGAGTL